MKKISLTTILLAISAGTTFAADLPSRKVPVIAPPVPPIWTGFHVGLNAGGTFGNNSALNSTTWSAWPYEGDLIAAALLSGSRNNAGNAGFIGGGQIGYDWQVPYGAMGFVTGVEADFQGIAGSGGSGSVWQVANFNYPDFGNGTVLSNAQGNSNLSWIGTVRGRLGYLVTPQLLLYGTGGLVYGQVNANIQNTQIWQDNTPGYVGVYGLTFGRGSYSSTQVGWTAGGGLEWMFMPNWSAKAEYLYYDLGKSSGTVVNNYLGLGAYSGDNGVESVSTYSGRVTGNIIRAGVNYHIDFASLPVVAKY